MEKWSGYTVHELAELSGISVRTLHHYDRIGLVPAQRGANGYRLYGHEEVDRLHQVLLHRETGMSLESIRRILDDPSFDATQALRAHLETLRAQRDHMDKIIENVEKAISANEEGESMSDNEKFEVFKAQTLKENEEKYGKEVRETWGEEASEASKEKFSKMTKRQWTEVQETESQMKDALAAGMVSGDPKGADALRAADLHRQWLCAFWPAGMYTKEAHRGMAEMYLTDQRFKDYYEAFGAGSAEFLHDAIIAYCS